MHPSESAPDDRPVDDVLRFQLVSYGHAFLHFPQEHALCAILSRCNTLWGCHSHIQSRQAAWNGRWRQNIGRAKLWIGIDKPSWLSFG